jgi:hypothetical protein
MTLYVPAAISRCLTVADRAQHTQVLQPMIVPLAIDVVDMHGQRLT